MLECKVVDTSFGAHVTPHLYKNCVVLFSVVYADVTEFVFGPADWGITEGEPTRGDMWYKYVVMYEFVTISLTGLKTRPWRIWLYI